MNYEKSSLKRILVDGGYYEEDKYYFYLRDHMGNNRVVADASGSAIQVTHYYPFGMSFAEGYEKEGIKPAKQPYKYNGKELDGENSLNWYDYEARQLAMDVPRFTSIDPHSEKYYSISLYVYVMNNPVNFINPDGRQIVGLTKDDALKVQQDLNTMFAGEKFDKFRGMFTLDKKETTFNSISTEAIKGAFEDITLSADEQSLVNEVAGVINSESVHKVEFVSIDGSVSKKGTSHLNNTQAGVGDAMIPSANMPGTTMNAVSGGGINIPTKNGSHLVIMEGKGVVHDGGRAVTTGHEVVGHDVASANKATPWRIIQEQLEWTI